MMKYLTLFVILCLFFVSSANARVDVLNPVAMSFTEVTDIDTLAHVLIMEEKYIGKVSPGQTIELTFSRYSGGKFNWTDATFSIPDLGVHKEFSAGPQNIIVYATIPETASEGQYRFRVNISNYLELRATESARFVVDVQRDIYDFVLPDGTTLYAGDNTALSIKIKSHSIAGEELTLGDFGGLPAKWSQTKPIYIGPLDEKTASFSINPLQEGKYDLQFKLTRKSSNLGEEKAFSLRVYPTIKAKLQGFGEGFSLVPMLLQPLYSILSWFGF